MDNILSNFDSLFHPKHIAFIGASEKSRFGAMLYLPAFRKSIWEHTFYPVNPKYEVILDWKCYPSVLDIPYPVDTAYISVKTKFIPNILKECVQKDIKWVIIFSSGFSETGDEEGLRLENVIKQIIQNSNTRVIGPNCLGPFNGSIGMAFSFNTHKGIPGDVSFMSQSGGHLNQLIDTGFRRDIRFRYGVSFGNQIDLNAIDFLKFYQKDDQTKIIAAYLESFGSGKGYDFYNELKNTTKKKPVIIWKGGHTEDGTRAAYSHTGAISSDLRLWNSMIKQTGATFVQDNEEFWNTIKTFELFYPKYLPSGRKCGIVTPGGGSSVNTTDLFNSYQLIVPELTQESQEKISQILPYENVNIKNPVDLGALGFVLDVFIDCINVVKEDPRIDIIILPLWPHFIYSHVFKRIAELQKTSPKPLAICLPSISDSIELAQRFSSAKKHLHKNRLLYYFNLRDAAKSLSLFCDYADFLHPVEKE